jgi:hypothetical protein
MSISPKKVLGVILLAPAVLMMTGMVGYIIVLIAQAAWNGDFFALFLIALGMASIGAWTLFPTRSGRLPR